ncbi:RluA family pseudouridine synthase [Phreatobacter sp.]|uniref:RluA family pseudouridine synthase n=1 Tax=Phreatobacter sp. TaxID=1966341 RepID=UPI0022C90E6B|nr:RluA family pseudouridine synthase [Phreatobacter sp.]MCZ8314595.1 RluA family pseudouridine synthase [Phreatobacter sp.]
MKGRGKPPGRGSKPGAPAGPRGPARAGSGRPPAKGGKPAFAKEGRPAAKRPPRSPEEADSRPRRGPEGEAGRRDERRPRFDGPDRAERPARRERPDPSELRSFDGSPRRGRADDWDLPEPSWSPEADLDMVGFEEERPSRRPARPARDERPSRPDRPSRAAPRESRAERPVRSAPSEDRPAPRRERPAAPPPAGPTRAELKAAATETLQTGVQTLTVTDDEADMRVDRFLAARFPQLSFSYIQRIVRKGELRVNGRRVETKDRLEAGQAVRVPPLKLDQARPMSAKVGEDVAGFLASITLYEDADVLVLSKPAGLAVQGGSGTKKHLDGMLAVLTDEDGQRPRLVHRLDKDTSGCLLVAKSRFAAAALAKTFRTRAARKIYWSVVAGVPKPRQGRVSTYLAKEEREDESFMRIAKHGEKGASHAVSYYAVIDTMAQKLSWLSMKPVTGRTHQLRVHAAEIGHPIIGDPKYFDVENWEIPGGIQHKLHLHARRLVVPHPRGKGTIDVSAPLPPHMEQTFNLLGWDVSRYDPIVEAPEE